MMGAAIVLGIVLATGLVIASGVWVAIVLVGAIMRPERPRASVKDRTADRTE